MQTVPFGLYFGTFSPGELWHRNGLVGKGKVWGH
jgi:hypothetical protein